ncbi:MAG: SH3 domain-containing protein [Anaerolineales bacterium]|nr:SH3 domain-containing protein [Anaerolineales bacterium]
MARFGIKISVWMLMLAGVFGLIFGSPATGRVQAQQPTGSVPTVTGTPSGAYITVNLDQDFVNIRSGPSSYFYPRVGVLLAGQSAPALGRSSGGDWIMISYVGAPGNVGWIYAPNVSLITQNFLPVMEAPPTPTPLATPTIDPTLAAAFIAPETPTRLPTFTPPAPLVVPTFVDDALVDAKRVPMGLVIFSLGFIGLLGALISVVRR